MIGGQPTFVGRPLSEIGRGVTVAQLRATTHLGVDCDRGLTLPGAALFKPEKEPVQFRLALRLFISYRDAWP
jgi:hypothetical protein